MLETWKSWFQAPESGLPTIRAASLHLALVSVLRIRMLIRDSHPNDLRAQTQAYHPRNKPLFSQPSRKPAPEADGGVQLPNRPPCETWGLTICTTKFDLFSNSC